MQAVRRRKDQPAPFRSAEEASRGVTQAIIRFAMAEFPLAIALAAGLFWLTATDNGLSADRQAMLIAGLFAAFTAAVAALFWTILWPALKRKRAFDLIEKGR